MVMVSIGKILRSRPVEPNSCKVLVARLGWDLFDSTNTASIFPDQTLIALTRPPIPQTQLSLERKEQNSTSVWGFNSPYLSPQWLPAPQVLLWLCLQLFLLPKTRSFESEAHVESETFDSSTQTSSATGLLWVPPSLTSYLRSCKLVGFGLLIPSTSWSLHVCCKLQQCLGKARRCLIPTPDSVISLSWTNTNPC